MMESIFIILLVIALIAIVWVVVRNMVESGVESSEACFNIYEKVTLNNQYTCWNATASEFQFSVSLADIEVDSVIVLVLGEGATKSYEITNTVGKITGLKNYDGSDQIKLPGKNGGLTYKTTDIRSKIKPSHIAQ